MSSTKNIIMIIGVAIAAFLGVIAGTEYIGWSKQKHLDNKVQGLAAGESTLLRKGDKFPQVELVGLNKTITSTQMLGENTNVLYLFLAIGCDPCTEAIQSWIKYTGNVPDNVKIYGLCEDDVDYAKVYIEKTGFPYPVYCDTNYVLSGQYDMDVYPSAVGVKSDGTIAFVQHGVGADFSPLEAAQRLLKNK